MVVRSSPATFRMPLRRGKKGPQPGDKIFTPSWSDFFIDKADEWRDAAWSIMRARPDLIFQIPTKRVDRVAAHLPDDWGDGWPNVWIGASVEDQCAADKRIPALLNVPARVRFISAEPLLGPLDLRAWYDLPALPYSSPAGYPAFTETRSPIGWVIFGGESGPDARACSAEWLEKAVAHALVRSIPAFVKQLGARYEDAPNGIAGSASEVPTDIGRHVRRLTGPGADPAEWMSWLRVQEFPDAPLGAARQAATPPP